MFIVKLKKNHPWGKILSSNLVGKIKISQKVNIYTSHSNDIFLGVQNWGGGLSTKENVSICNDF